MTHNATMHAVSSTHTHARASVSQAAAHRTPLPLLATRLQRVRLCHPSAGERGAAGSGAGDGVAHAHPQLHLARSALCWVSLRDREPRFAPCRPRCLTQLGLRRLCLRPETCLLRSLTPPLPRGLPACLQMTPSQSCFPFGDRPRRRLQTRSRPQRAALAAAAHPTCRPAGLAQRWQPRLPQQQAQQRRHPPRLQVQRLQRPPSCLERTTFSRRPACPLGSLPSGRSSGWAA